MQMQMPPPARPIHPVGGQAHYQTYVICDAGDRTVVAACQDVGCLAWRSGWESAFNEADACGSGPGVQCVRVRLGGAVCGSCAAQYVRLESGRDFTEARSSEGLTVFKFAAYQRCFADHHTAPRLYARRRGDWRSNPYGRVEDELRLMRGGYVHKQPSDWAEDFAQNRQTIADAIQRG